MILLSSLSRRRCKGSFQQQHQRRTFQMLPNLTYDITAGVPPVLSGPSTLFHYKDIHYRQCYELNSALYGSGNEGVTIEEVININRRYADDAPVYCLATDHYNHTLMWYSIYPGGVEPTPWMRNWMETYFGGLERFQEMWKASCRRLFGSGWCCLVNDQGFPVIKNTYNSDSPVANGITPVLVIDLWEHAYYPDYGTNREAYVKNWLQAINWEFVEQSLKNVVQQKNITNHPDISFGKPKKLLWDSPLSQDNPYIKKETTKNIIKGLLRKR